MLTILSSYTQQNNKKLFHVNIFGFRDNYDQSKVDIC